MEPWLEAAPIDPERRALEVVERKGLGHPDTLCDAAADAFSRRLSRHYLEHAGALLHHNVDKALLAAGETRVRFGGGEWRAPIELTLAGRATLEAGGRPVPLEALARAALADALAPLRELSPERVRLRVAVRPGAPELRAVHDAVAAAPRAGDTSFGVGFAPMTSTEALALEIDRRLLALAGEPGSPVGEDSKCMLVREREALRVTVAAAMRARELADLAAYRRAVERVRACAEAAAREAGFAKCEVAANAADGDAPYLTLSGSSAECGDDGQVGRGNRLSGLITPMRPMTLEAAAGKSPRSHVGRLLQVAAQRAAERCAELSGVRAAECLLVSRIGAPLDAPLAAGLRIDAPRRAVHNLREELCAIAVEEARHLPGLWRELVGPSGGPRRDEEE